MGGRVGVGRAALAAASRLPLGPRVPRQLGSDLLPGVVLGGGLAVAVPASVEPGGRRAVVRAVATGVHPAGPAHAQRPSAGAGAGPGGDGGDGGDGSGECGSVADSHVASVPHGDGAGRPHQLPLPLHVQSLQRVVAGCRDGVSVEAVEHRPGCTTLAGRRPAGGRIRRGGGADRRVRHRPRGGARDLSVAAANRHDRLRCAGRCRGAPGGGDGASRVLRGADGGHRAALVRALPVELADQPHLRRTRARGPGSCSPWPSPRR